MSKRTIAQLSELPGSAYVRPETEETADDFEYTAAALKKGRKISLKFIAGKGAATLY